MLKSMTMALAVGALSTLAYSQEALVGSSPVPGNSNLYALTTSPFSSRLIGLTGVVALSGLDFSPISGTLYGSTGNAGGGTIYTVDPSTGASVLVGASGFAAVAGLVFDGATLYGSASLAGGVADTLVTIDPVTGLGRVIGAYGPGIGGIDSLEIDARTGSLIGMTGFFFDGSPGDVFVIDTTTGAARLIGSLTEAGRGTILGATLAGLTYVGPNLIGSLGGGNGTIIGIDLASFTWTFLGDATPGGGSVSDLAYRPPVTCSTEARFGIRNAGSNPSSYAVGGSHGGNPVLGGTLDLTVNASGTTGHRNSTILGFLSPATIVLAGGQVLLLDLGSSSELLGLGLQGGDTNLIGAPIPYDLAICGLAVSTQGLHIGGVRPFALSNAVDFVFGGF